MEWHKLEKKIGQTLFTIMFVQKKFSSLWPFHTQTHTSYSSATHAHAHDNAYPASSLASLCTDSEEDSGKPLREGSSQCI